MKKNSIKSLILPVSNIAIHAGVIINKYYKSKLKFSLKKDNSPLTEADISSNNYIINSLSILDPKIPIFSEESNVPWKIRKKWQRYWLVDPLDGTKEFLNKNNEFTVNIALIEKNKPILGVIYAPALFELFYASFNNGSFKIITKKKIKSINKSIKIISNKKNKTDSLKILGSRSHSNSEFNKWISKNFNNYKLIKKGSSLKYCYIAEGKADLCIRLGSTSEWDIAAGDIILTEAGGKLKTLDNKKIFYNKKESVINPHFIASCNIKL